jgi:hypothetical protein
MHEPDAPVSLTALLPPTETTNRPNSCLFVTPQVTRRVYLIASLTPASSRGEVSSWTLDPYLTRNLDCLRPHRRIPTCNPDRFGASQESWIKKSIPSRNCRPLGPLLLQLRPRRRGASSGRLICTSYPSHVFSTSAPVSLVFPDRAVLVVYASLADHLCRRRFG